MESGRRFRSEGTGLQDFAEKLFESVELRRSAFGPDSFDPGLASFSKLGMVPFGPRPSGGSQSLRLSEPSQLPLDGLKDESAATAPPDGRVNC